MRPDQKAFTFWTVQQENVGNWNKTTNYDHNKVFMYVSVYLYMVKKVNTFYFLFLEQTDLLYPNVIFMRLWQFLHLQNSGPEAQMDH